MPRLDTRLESEGAEFLVLGNLLLERIPAYKTYANMPGYDLVATNPERNTSVKIQVKSRWRTNAPGFPIRNFDCDFVVFCRLNRGSKRGTAIVRAPEIYVFPVDVVRSVWISDDPWGKVLVSRIEGWEQYRNRWDLIRNALSGASTHSTTGAHEPHGESGGEQVDARTGAPMTLDEFRRLVASLDGEMLRTSRHEKRFSVIVLEQGLELTPESSGRARRVGWKGVERVLARYSDSGSLRTRDYRDITRHSSYMLAILSRISPLVRD